MNLLGSIQKLLNGISAEKKAERITKPLGKWKDFCFMRVSSDPRLGSVRASTILHDWAPQRKTEMCHNQSSPATVLSQINNRHVSLPTMLAWFGGGWAQAADDNTFRLLNQWSRFFLFRANFLAAACWNLSFVASSVCFKDNDAGKVDGDEREAENVLWRHLSFVFI